MEEVKLNIEVTETGTARARPPGPGQSSAPSETPGSAQSPGPGPTPAGPSPPSAVSPREGEAPAPDQQREPLFQPGEPESLTNKLAGLTPIEQTISKIGETLGKIMEPWRQVKAQQEHLESMLHAAMSGEPLEPPDSPTPRRRRPSPESTTPTPTPSGPSGPSGLPDNLGSESPEPGPTPATPPLTPVSAGGAGGTPPPPTTPPTGGPSPAGGVPPVPIQAVAVALLAVQALESVGGMVASVFNKIVEAGTRLTNFLLDQAEQSVGFSPEATSASIEAKLSELDLRIRRAEEVGTELAQFRREFTELNRTISTLQNELIDAFGEFGSKTVDRIDTLVWAGGETAKILFEISKWIPGGDPSGLTRIFTSLAQLADSLKPLKDMADRERDKALLDFQGEANAFLQGFGDIAALRKAGEHDPKKPAWRPRLAGS